MNLQAAIANAAWLASSLPEWRRFKRVLADPAATQAGLLRGMLSRNASCAFGRLRGFESIRSIEEFRERVPLGDYETFEPFVDRLRAGEQSVLTSDAVKRLAPTSGTTSGRKLIPFTAGLQRAFDRAIAAWMVDLARQRPGIVGGPAYWSITPAFESDPVESKIPVGFDDDATYLGGIKAWLVRNAIIAPPRSANTLERFQTETLRRLRNCRELRMISVWHPSFLALLLDRLPDWRELWPNLQVISCWGDAAAESGAMALREKFSGVLVQPKGLLATETAVTIPFEGAYPLAIRSAFFEFIDEAGEVRLAHELCEGCEYELVVTTPGGLWRYRLKDWVRVTGFLGATPSLRFIGRRMTSDLRGEKLTEEFVGERLQRVFGAGRFALVAPNAEARGYTLFIEGVINARSLREFESLLRENPHYAHCVNLGQLARLRCFEIASNAYESFARHSMKRGARLGDVKPARLSQRTDWAEAFEGAYRTDL